MSRARRLEARQRKEEAEREKRENAREQRRREREQRELEAQQGSKRRRDARFSNFMALLFSADWEYLQCRNRRHR
jgi:hypothetical protein